MPRRCRLASVFGSVGAVPELGWVGALIGCRLVAHWDGTSYAMPSSFHRLVGKLHCAEAIGAALAHTHNRSVNKDADAAGCRPPMRRQVPSR